ncbi:MAG: tRNA(Met) cytidine acetyltransferase [Candidatus Diapherotrites archaeon]|nr:tRNA(Met) cytidine acetyltransferase [Candidatus Diapherotrites archaeon]MDN5366601.1 tRNA(Met) cytidine acetyltransferase [Candidatus Diapherotrites archaeon]
MEFVRKALETAAATRQRRLFVISGDWKKGMKVVGQILREARDFVGRDLLYFAEFPKESDIGERRFKEFARNVHGLGYLVQKKPFAIASSVLGRTYDVLVLDAYENFPPRDIGIIVETVRGPGVIVLLVPELPKWASSKLFFHEQYVVTPPYSVKDCRDIFLNRVVKKLFEHDGIYILSDEGKPVKLPKEKKAKKRKRKLKIPKEHEFPDEIYQLALTQDQIDVIHALENVPKAKKHAYVILADRGRGKSAAMGLALAGILSSKKWKVVVTAPSFQNAEEVFRFIRTGLEALGKEYKEKKREISVKEGGEVVFLEPLEAVERKADILVVDEAAGIYVSILRSFMQRYKRIVFATTTHGYEGTGRLFQYRFLPALQEKFEVKTLRMSEPIRYGEGDPIEQWLYDVFLLDAEPADLTEEDLKQVAEGRLVFEKLDVEKLFLEDEETLRQFIGIYVYAHYRNNPRDVAILADAPNQNAFAVRTESGKIVCSLQIAEEGGLPKAVIDLLKEGEIVQGNIIPDLMLKYYGYDNFARAKGLRVVRIATHPELQGKGIGSFALKNLIDYARDNDYAWVGAVFGSSDMLLRFWMKNGFIPVHVSPKRNPESGEYSTAVLYPLRPAIKDIVNVSNFGMKLRLAYELDNFYRNMEARVALLLFSSGEKRDVPLDLTTPEKRKLKRMVEGGLHYDALSEVIYRMTINYFIGKMEPPMEEKDRLYLIEKVLKKRTWKGVGDVFGKDPMKVARRLDRILYGLARWYLGEVS